MKPFIALIFLCVVCFSLESQALPRDFLQKSPAGQRQYQYDQMVATAYGKELPSYFGAACSQGLAVASAPLQVIHTFTNRSPESRAWQQWLPGGKLFHTMGATVALDLVINRGRSLQTNLLLPGMGRFSLGAPPLGGKFVPGFAFLLYEQGRNPVGVHTISPTILQSEPKFFLNDLTNKLPAPTGVVVGSIVNGLGKVIHTPLHLSTQQLIQRLEREGVDVSAYADADQIILRPPLDSIREDESFLKGVRAFGPSNFLRQIQEYQGLDGILYQVIAVSPKYGEQVLGYLRMTDPIDMPVIASAYGDHRFHIPHMTRRNDFQVSPESLLP